MDTTFLQEKILSWFPEVRAEMQKEFLTLEVPSGNLYDLAIRLKTDPDLLMDFLFSQTGVDWGKELGVVYHLTSTKHGHSVVLKVKTADRENPEFDTVCDIWRTAEFQEREIFDLLGIRFKNHPDLRRIFLDDNWKGFPLRKDYQDEVNIVEF